MAAAAIDTAQRIAVGTVYALGLSGSCDKVSWVVHSFCCSRWKLGVTNFILFNSYAGYAQRRSETAVFHWEIAGSLTLREHKGA